MPSCRRLGGVHTTQSFSFLVDAIIKGFSLLICTAPALIQPQLAICRVNYRDLSTEIAQWRLLPRSKIGINDYKSDYDLVLSPVRAIHLLSLYHSVTLKMVITITSTKIPLLIERNRPSYAKAMQFGAGCSSYPSDSLPASRTNSPLPPSVPLPTHVISNSSPSDLRADKLYFFGPPSSPPVEHTKELITLYIVGKQSPLKPPTTPKVPIVNPIVTLKNLGSPPTCAFHPVQNKGNSSLQISPPLHNENIILAQPVQGLNEGVPINMDPLNAMDEDLFEEPNENNYEDS
ncbi:hypothetical protein Cgig2_014437 [Carnegiea gigantea]|uniref:Uncharacterized protein n=1 Tax=Carnegiea gigantea TaxID=171969 RepID=A0A9Q1Q8C4_9CARY|nr:hypothetical protein Cgig2_014437 [Carnegiea gigantea]